jgi:hypothetical protein
MGYWKWFKKQYITKGNATLLCCCSICIVLFGAYYHIWFLYDCKLWLYNVAVTLGNYQLYTFLIWFFAVLPVILLLILFAFYLSYSSYKESIEKSKNN